MPAVRIRGVPAEAFIFEGNALEYTSVDAAVEQTGIPGRYSPDYNGWVNMFIDGNTWNIDFG